MLAFGARAVLVFGGPPPPVRRAVQRSRVPPRTSQPPPRTAYDHDAPRSAHNRPRRRGRLGDAVKEQQHPELTMRDGARPAPPAMARARARRPSLAGRRRLVVVAVGHRLRRGLRRPLPARRAAGRWGARLARGGAAPRRRNLTSAIDRPRRRDLMRPAPTPNRPAPPAPRSTSKHPFSSHLPHVTRCVTSHRLA